MIKLEDVFFQYEGANESLHNLSLHIHPGECAVITGVSGCGKTTVTRLINGLIPHFYPGRLRGNVEVCGKIISETEPHQLSMLVGSVFQNPRTQFFHSDTDSELVFGMENMGIGFEEMHRRYENTLKELNLSELAHQSIFALSGGQKQQIALGSVYAMTPDIYVLDEPSSNLDQEAIKRLAKLLRYIKSLGKTILIAEHRLYYLNGIADRIILMENGRIAEEWSADTFTKKTATELAAAGLRSCRPTALLSKNAESHDSLAMEVRNLSISYGKYVVLENIDFALGKGKIVGITGENGIGKTTLSRTICGLHKDWQGTILFEGKAIPKKKQSQYAYLVMQDPNYQLFADSVLHELLLVGYNQKSPVKEQIKEIACELSIDSILECHPHALSGGQKQRVAVALAALSPAKVLLFDEPTSGLDYSNMQRVVSILRRLSQKGKSILIISHDFEMLNQACDEVIHLTKSCKKRKEFIP